VIARITGGEEYKCSQCEKTKTFEEINNNWKCDVCGYYISIKFLWNNEFKTVFRKKFDELEELDYVPVTSAAAFSLITYAVKDDNVLLRLKEYGTKIISKNTWIETIQGRWV